MKVIKKILITALVLLNSVFAINAQVSQELYDQKSKEYDKKVTEIDLLNRTLGETEKERNDLSDKNKKLDKQIDELSEKNKELAKQIDDLNKAKENLQNKIDSLKLFEKKATEFTTKYNDCEKSLDAEKEKTKELAGLKKEVVDLKKEKENLDKEKDELNDKLAKAQNKNKRIKPYETRIKKLEGDSSDYSTQIINLKKTIEENKNQIKILTPYKNKVATLTSDKTKLSKIIKEKQSTIEQKEKTIKDLTPYKAKAEKLKQDSLNLKNKFIVSQKDVEQLKKELKQCKPYKQKNVGLTEALKSNINYTVNYLINSSDYNVAKTDELINKCNNMYVKYINKQNIQSYVTKLNNYKSIAMVINKSRSILKNKFNTTNVNTAKNELNNVKTKASTNAKKDISHNYKILSSYCKTNNDAKFICDKADNYKELDQAKARRILKEYLNNLSVDYVYLRSEINKKIRNPFYACKISKCDK